MKNTLKRSLALLLVLLFAIPTFAFAEDLGVEAVSVEDIALVEDVATDDVVVEQAEEAVEDDNLDLAEENVVLGDEEEEIAETNGTFNVEFDLAGGKVGNNATYGPVSTDGGVNLPTVTRNGYTFAGWTGNDGSSYAATATTATVTKDTKFTANWTADPVTVTYYDFDNTTAVVTQNALYGDALVKPAQEPQPANGKGFKEWLNGKKGDNDVIKVLFSGDKEITAANEAAWKIGGANLLPIQDANNAHAWTLGIYPNDIAIYAVHFYDGKTSIMDPVNVYNGYKMDNPAPTKANKTFLAWTASEDESDKSPVNFITVGTDGKLTFGAYGGNSASEVKVYAKYSAEVHTIKFIKSGYFSDFNVKADNYVSDTGIATYNYDTKTVKPVYTMADGFDGYGVAGWTDETGAAFTFGATLTKNVTLTPVIKAFNTLHLYTMKKNYPTTLVTIKDAQSQDLTVKVFAGETAAAPATPTEEGGKFVGWYKAEKNASNQIVIPATETAFSFPAALTADTYVYAKFNFDNVTTYPVTVKYQNANGELVTEPVQYIVANEYATEPAKIPEVSGKAFDHWEDTSDGSAFVFATTKITKPVTVQAVYATANCQVTINTNGGSSIPYLTVPKNGTIPFEGLRQTATQKAHYNPDVVTIESVAYLKLYKDAAFTTAWDYATDKVTENTTLFVKWIGVPTEISFNTNGGTPASVASVTVPYGSSFAEAGVTAPTVKKDGATHVGWTYEKTVNGKTTIVDFDTVQDPVLFEAATTLTAKFATDVWTVKFETDGGTAVAEQYIENGKTINTKGIIQQGKATKTEVAPVKAGFQVACWYADKAKLTPVDLEQVTITGNTTFYVEWEAAAYEVVFIDPNGGLYDEREVEYNETVTEPKDYPRDDYVVLGWYTDVDLTKPYDFTKPVTADLELYAKTALSSHLLLIDPTDPYYDSADPWDSAFDVVETKKGTVPKKPDDAPNKPNAAFAGWYADAAFTTPYTFTDAISEDVPVYAKFETAVTRKVTFHLGWPETIYNNNDQPTGSKPEDIEVNVVKGKTVTAPNVDFGDREKTDIFEGWFVCSPEPIPNNVHLVGDHYEGDYEYNVLSTTPFDFSTPIDENVDLVHVWTPKQFTVTLIANGKVLTTATVNSHNTGFPYEYGQNVPNVTGYNFLNDWCLDAALTIPYRDRDFTKDTTLYAKYEPMVFEATVNPGAGKFDQSDYGQGKDLQYNDEKHTFYVAARYGETLPKIPTPTANDNNQSFAGWYTDAACTKAFDPATKVTGGFTLYAKYLNKVTLNLTATGWVYDGKTHPDKVNATVTKAYATDVIPATVIEYKKAGDPDTAYTTSAPKDAGSYKVRATVAGTAKTAPAEKVVDLAIVQKDVTLEWDSNTKFTYTGAEQAPKATAKGTVEGETVTVTVKGATKVGSYTAEASLPADGNYKLSNSAVKTCPFTIEASTTEPTTTATINADGTVTVTVTAADGSKISESKIKIGESGSTDDFTVTTKDNGDGTVTVTLTAKEGSGFKLSTPITVTGKIALPTATKITALKPGKKKMTVSWDVVTDADGYQIQYGLKKSAAKKMTPKKFTGATTAKATIKKLKKGKKYYFRIRTFKTVNGTTVYSDWSAWKKSAKVK